MALLYTESHRSDNEFAVLARNERYVVVGLRVPVEQYLFFGHVKRHRFAGFTTCAVFEAGLHRRLPMADLVRPDVLTGNLRRGSLYNMCPSLRGLLLVPDCEPVFSHPPVIRTLIPRDRTGRLHDRGTASRTRDHNTDHRPDDRHERHAMAHNGLLE